MATLTVTTLADDGSAGGLRAVLGQANATAAADTVVFAAGLEGGTLTLTRGQLEIASDVTIDGDGNNDGREVQVSGNNASRVIEIDGSGTDARLVDLTISGGNTYGAPGGQEEGGGIRLGAGQALSLEGCTVTGNTAAAYGAGGGIFADEGARLNVAHSTISANAADRGGGIFLSDGCTAVIETSRVTENTASDLSPSGTGSGGGGIALQGTSLVLTRSTVDGNYADYGAGVLSSRSQLTVQTSTIAENSTLGSLFGGSGAGLSLDAGYAFLANSTVTGNRVGRYDADDVELSGGIDANGRLSLANTIVAANFQGASPQDSTASDVEGAIAASNGHNIFGSNVTGNVAGDIENAGAGFFGALTDNGGPTPTVREFGLSYSAGEPVAVGSADQRGFSRPIPTGSNADIGAFEAATSVSTTATSGNDVLTGTAAADTLNGLAGVDLVLGRAGSDTLNGAAAGDTLRGGAGDDRLDGDTGLDTASYRDAAAAVTASLAAGAASGGAGSDVLREIENLEGGRFADSLTGNASSNWLGGREGADRLFGRDGDDWLLDAAGADRLNGGRGRDSLSGGASADIFDYDQLADSTVGGNRDRIADFAHLTDKLDLSTIDARAATPAVNDSFNFLSAEGSAFSAPAQLRWFREGGSTFVEANVDAGLGADLQIELAGLASMSAGDFIL